MDSSSDVSQDVDLRPEEFEFIDLEPGWATLRTDRIFAVGQFVVIRLPASGRKTSGEVRARIKASTASLLAAELRTYEVEWAVAEGAQKLASGETGVAPVRVASARWGALSLAAVAALASVSYLGYGLWNAERTTEQPRAAMEHSTAVRASPASERPVLSPQPSVVTEQVLLLREARRRGIRLTEREMAAIRASSPDAHTQAQVAHAQGVTLTRYRRTRREQAIIRKMIAQEARASLGLITDAQLELDAQDRENRLAIAPFAGNKVIAGSAPRDVRPTVAVPTEVIGDAVLAEMRGRERRNTRRALVDTLRGLEANP